MSADLTPLIARVDAATGPDREIDAALWCALLHPDCKPSQSRPGHIAITDDDPSRWGYKEAPHYTASIDAALALVNAKLPGWRWIVHNLGDGPWARVLSPDFDCVVWEAGDRVKHDVLAGKDAAAIGATPALALISALLRALLGSERHG